MSCTLAARAAHGIEARHSRFLARAAPVADPGEALAFLAEVADAAATHNCWAYRIGAEYRSSDDGEPAGTAGRPILAAIDGQDLDRVVVVVTRWFGGVKLGVGGLVRAYGGCAAECLRLAAMREIVERVHAVIHCEFAAVPLLYSRLADFDARRLSEQASVDGMALEVEVPGERIEALAGFVRDLTRGRGRIETPA